MINILIPMAGLGRRFKEKGYTKPKPLIDVRGQPMIKRVIDNLDLGVESQFIFIIQEQHDKEFKLGKYLSDIKPGCEVITINGITDGAACTVLLANRLINNSIPLLVANSDQLVSFNKKNFLTIVNSEMNDCIFTFTNTDPKFSYVALNRKGEIVNVVEKNPISNIATCGVYFAKQGAHLVHAIKEMIENQDKTNGEYYLAPAYNYFKYYMYGATLPFFVDEMICLGTPEDLEKYNKESVQVYPI